MLCFYAKILIGVKYFLDNKYYDSGNLGFQRKQDSQAKYNARNATGLLTTSFASFGLRILSLLRSRISYKAGSPIQSKMR